MPDFCAPTPSRKIGASAIDSAIALASHGAVVARDAFDEIDPGIGRILLDAAVAEIDREVEDIIEPFRQAVSLLTSIPGISDLSARVILAEIGRDMSRFPTAGHLVSWAGLCPRNDESAGKRRSRRLRKGDPWLKTALVQCAWAASRKKQSYLRAQHHRIRSRGGAKKATCAVAASIITAIYHMLKDGTFYQDLGYDHFDRRTKTAHTKRLVNRLKNLGYSVQIEPIAA
ncbi:MAG: IS110 family transposase [Hyphomicrobiales bacterium]|nr:IS110 family transposase [Hyphomicrobiales bacterium]